MFSERVLFSLCCAVMLSLLSDIFGVEGPVGRRVHELSQVGAHAGGSPVEPLSVDLVHVIVLAGRQEALAIAPHVLVQRGRLLEGVLLALWEGLIRPGQALLHPVSSSFELPAMR